MLRNRTRGITSKQGLMADPGLGSQSSPPKKPVSFFFGSPRFKAFSTKESEAAAMSPTSILDTKSSFPFGNPFGYDLNINPTKSPKIFSANQQNSGVGLALIDDSPVEDPNSSERNRKMVLFGTKLKVQIPSSPTESPKSPADFGTKTRNSVFHAPATDYPSPRIWTGSLPVSDMEMSEDYTRVVLHGANPKTTHIFDNCIVGSYSFAPPGKSELPSESFLSSCFTCKKKLEENNDIYIYRGDKAFCSIECRHKEMVLDGLEK